MHIICYSESFVWRQMIQSSFVPSLFKSSSAVAVKAIYIRGSTLTLAAARFLPPAAG